MVKRLERETSLKGFWQKVLEIPRRNFYKTYRKETRSDRKTYKGMFPYGTCVVSYHDRDTNEYVMAGIKYLRTRYMIAVK